ncbi:MAG TPA: hypothetical protein VD931_18100 [Baekduia sp.]|nr:hypothetical protein [Baekduia sp.]
MPPRPRRSPPPSQAGQASVELVALLPLLAVVGLLLWQAVVAGHAVWAAGAAARSAARAAAVGQERDAARAARRVLGDRLARGVRVRARPSGEVAVTLRLPSVAGGTLGSYTARSRMEPQR